MKSELNSIVDEYVESYGVDKNDSNDWDEFLEEINVAVNLSFNRSLEDNFFFILYNFDKSCFFSNGEMADFFSMHMIIIFGLCNINGN